jgi:carbon-monoxide dehydrogenase medium subunit
MKPAPFTYHRARSAEDAVERLAAGDGMARLLAGGQSLVPMLNLRLAPAADLVDIGAIESFRRHEELPGALRIGACVTHGTIQRGEIPDPANGLMARVAAGIAYQAVRNRGTIGGSMALADPSADWVSLLVALDATVEWVGQQGAQQGPAAGFMLGAYTTRLDFSDVLTALVIPRLSSNARFGYYKICRKTGEFASSLAAVINDRQRRYSRVVLGATGGAPIILGETSLLLATAPRWNQAMPDEIIAAFNQDILHTGRDFSEVALSQHRASVVRAVKESLI